MHQLYEFERKILEVLNFINNIYKLRIYYLSQVSGKKNFLWEDKKSPF